MTSKKFVTRGLAIYMIASLILPINLLLTNKTYAQNNEENTQTNSVQTGDSETNTPPVFSVIPNDPPINNDDTPPPPKKEIKNDSGNSGKEPQSTDPINNNNSQRSGEPEIDSYKYAVANNASKADVDGMTGAFTYSIDLYTPPGRTGMEPNLSLNYSSQNKNELNWVGYGWDLSIPSIQRQNKYGVYQSPTNNLYTVDTFTSSLNGELATTSTIGVFNAKSDDGSFLKSNFSSSTNQWTVESKDGTAYKFGHSQSAQIYNSATTTEVYKWMVEEVRDLNGNYITYEYFQDAGYIYPETITYTNDATSTGIFTVDFTLEERQDTATSTEAGFPMTSNYRISQITVSVDSEWVRKYDFEYTTGDNGRRSLLQSITESARDEKSQTTTELPPTTFSYQESIPGWTTTTDFALPEKFKNDYSGDNRDTGLRAVDLNADALVDLLLSKNGSTRKMWLNDGDSWEEITYDPSFPNIDFVSQYGDDNFVRFIDTNGDGRTDVVYTNGTYLNFESGWTYGGSGWSNSDVGVGVRFADISGEGLTDRLASKYCFWGCSNGTNKIQNIRLNNGTNWYTVDDWQIPGQVFEFESTGVFDPIAAEFVDVNNDGLTDIVSKGDDQDVYGVEGVFLNNGRGSWYGETSWIIPNDMSYSGNDYGQKFVDVNSDGLVDIIDGHTDGGTGDRDIYINNGSNWVLSSTWKAPVAALPHSGGGSGNGYTTQIWDIDGDGVQDFIQRDENAHGRWLNNTKPADVLININESTGSKVDVTYKSSAQYRDSGGDLLNPNLPFVVQTTENITIKDGFGNIASDLNYEYSNGYFYFNNSFDKKFVGFGKLEKIDSEGNITKTYFHQGNESASTTGEYNDHISKAGKPYRIEIYDDQGNLYSKTISKWESINNEGESYFVKLTNSIEFTYDGDSDHKEKATSFSYDNTSGNLTQQIEFGEVSGSDDGTFTDSGSDKFITNLTYATSTATSTITKLSQETTLDNSGNKVREKKVYYDNLSFGNLNKGNPTKEEQWKSDSSYIDIERTFNDYGLVTQEKDPRDKTTTYVYDRHNLYPATTTNPEGHVTERYYDYSSGQVTELKDSNEQTYQKIYDAFDRILEEKQPSLSTSIPIGGPNLDIKTKYVYTDDTFPRQVKKINYLTSSLTVDSYFYFDGLNRKAEERIEAEDSNTFKVKDFEYDSRGLLVEESLPFFGTDTSYTGTSSPAASYLLIEYDYDPVGRLTKLTNNVGSTTNTYDDWVVTTTDSNGSVKEYTKDAYNNLVQVEENNATSTYTTIYEWNGNKNLTKITDAEGNIRNFTYDGLGRRLSAEDLHDSGDGTYGTWTYTYDDSGNLASSTDPKNQTINYTYDDINRVLTEDYTDSAGTEIEYGYDFCQKGKGFLCSATSTDSVLNLTYNTLGLPKTETKTIDSIDYTTEYTYNRQGNFTKVEHPDNSQTRYTFNTAGLLETIEQKEVGGLWTDVVIGLDYGPTDQIVRKHFNNEIESTYNYNDEELYRLKKIHTVLNSGLRGNGDDPGDKIIKKETEDSTEPLSLSQILTEDRLLGSKELENEVIRYAYKTDKKIENTASKKVVSKAKEIGLKITRELEEKRTKNSRTFYTDNNKLFITEIISGVPQYHEDKNGDWWQVDYATTTKESFEKQTVNKKISFWGKIKNLLLEKVYAQEESIFRPESEANTIDGYVAHLGGGSWSALRSASGSASGDSSHSDIYIEADATGWRSIYRLIRLFDTSSIPDEHTILGATYTEHTYSKGHDSFGCEVNIYSSNPASNTDLTAGDFDSLGGDENEGQPFASPHTMASMSGTDGAPTDWELNSTGLIFINKTGITKFGVRESKYDGANVEPQWSQNHYCNFAFHDADQTGTSKDPKLTIVHGMTYEDIQKIYYSYDNVGNITKIEDYSGTEAAKTIDFEYDDLYRLTTASTTAATSTPFRETYSYNSLGNITNKSDQGSYTYSETGYANPHAATSIDGISLTYDNNGNLTSFGTNSYTWDWKNRMTSASQELSTTNYYYDHTQQRVKKTTGGAGATTTIFPNKYFDKTGATSTRHIYDDRGGLIATIEANGEATSTYYIHTDHLGGTNVVTDEEGEVVEVTDYLPFGEINTNQAPTGVKTDRKYTSHTYDEESDLNYMNARYQDGEIGRFLSQDPAFQVVGDPRLKAKTQLELDQYLSNPQHLNSYSYVANNPIKYQDPTGEFLETGIDLVSLSLSLNDFQQNPSLGNAAWVGADALSLALPGIPALGILRHGDGVAKGIEAARETTEQIVRFGVEFAKNSNFKMTERVWSSGRVGDSVGSLVDHYVRHGEEVGARSVGEYYNKANDFISNQKVSILGRGGDLEYFDPIKGRLAVTGLKGEIRTFRVIDKNSQRYKDLKRAYERKSR